MKSCYILAVGLIFSTVAPGKEVSISDVDKANLQCLMRESVIHRIHDFAVPESPKTGHKLTHQPISYRWRFGMDKYVRVYPGYNHDIYSYATAFEIKRGNLITYSVWGYKGAFGKMDQRIIKLDANEFPHISYEKQLPLFDKYGTLITEKSMVSGLKIVHRDHLDAVMINPRSGQPSELTLDVRSYVDCLEASVKALEAVPTDMK